MRSLPSFVLLATLPLRAALGQELFPLGTPDVGGSAGFQVTGPPGTAVLFLGFATLNPPVSLPGVGNLWIPLDVLLGSGGVPLSVSVPIPPVAALSGISLTVQAGIAVANPPSIVPTNPLRVRIGPPPAILPSPPVSSGFLGNGVALGNASGGAAADVLVGETGAPSGTTANAGAVRIHAWTGSGFGPASSLFAPSPQVGESFGWRIAVGDVDGDGSNDVVASAPGWDASAAVANVGRVVVFFGPAFAATIPLAPPTPLAGLAFGRSLAVADFDGAGTPEVAVGAPVLPSGGGAPGRVFVFGALGAPTPTVLTILDPLAPPGDFGQSLAAGDVNGDSLPDLAVADPEAAGTTISEGRVHVYGGPALAFLYTLAAPTPGSEESFGSAVAIGDLTGDAIGDVLAGQRGSPSGTDAAAYVYAGVPAGPPPLVATLLPHPPSSAAFSFFGTSAAIGDLDGNGANDAIVGQPGATGLGAVWVYYGTPGGTALLGLPSRLSVSGSLANGFGLTLATGDATGNGVADLLVGAPLTGTLDAGAAHLFPN